MKHIVLVIVLAINSITAISQQTLSETIIHDGLQREYMVYISETFDTDIKSPLLLNFHGYGSNAQEQMVIGDFRKLADSLGFLLIHPIGTFDVDNKRHWNVGWGNSTVDDVGFIQALINKVKITYNIDGDRVYASGLSNGGFFSYKLACELSNSIASAASVAGSMTKGTPASCFPDRPIPIMEIHGTFDNVIPYNGNSFSESIPDVIAHWVDHNNTEQEPLITALPDIDPSDGSTVELSEYRYGDNGAEVHLYKIIDGQHSWPGSVIGGGRTNRDINASEKIWQFVSRYDLSGLIFVTDTEEIAAKTDKVKAFPNPAQTTISFERESSTTVPIQITNISGQLVYNSIVTESITQIDISSLKEGLYFVRMGNSMTRFIKSR